MVDVSVLVVDNEGVDVVTQAFLHHQDAPYLAVIIVKWMNAFKMHMHIQVTINEFFHSDLFAGPEQ